MLPSPTMNPIALHALGMMVQALHPSPARAVELEDIAVDIGSTDASEVEAEMLVSICLHESHCRLDAVGDGGRARGPWQVRLGRPDARTALERVRWSYKTCRSLGMYACGRCACDPAVLASLQDPTLPCR